MPDYATNDIRNKAGKVDSLLDGFSDEEAFEKIVDKRASIEADLSIFVGPYGEEELLRQVLSEVPGEVLCECADPLCPPKQEQIPASVRASRQPLIVALQNWEARHAGANVYRKYTEVKAEKRERVQRVLGECIQLARKAREEHVKQQSEAAD